MAADPATPSRSPLLGYPRVRGVIAVRGSTPGVEARRGATAAATARAASSPSSPCASAGPNLCWQGGPVVRRHTVHLIFWEGPTPHPAGVEGFPAGYELAVEAYFNAVAQESGAISDVYAVGAQYGDASGASGLYDVLFDAAADAYLDRTDSLPTPAESGCRDASAAAGVCIADGDLHGEIEAAIAANAGWVPSLEDVFFVFTPPQVGGCFGEGDESTTGCAFARNGNGYCAYHNSFANGGGPVLYAYVPDNGNVEGCDSFEHPRGSSGVDATLDAASREHEDIVTDPTGESWQDSTGREIAEKCNAPAAWEPYGAPLGGEPGALYNQLIGGERYWLQTEWSNAAGASEGGCEQRLVNTTFTPPSGVQATVPAAFDGSASGSLDDPIAYWEWDFGDEAAGGEFRSVSRAPTVSHAYALAGGYRVTLTAVDVYGNRNTTSRAVEVGAAPPAPSRSTPPAVTVATPTPAPIHLSAAQLAVKLGLPRGGALLAGLGTIVLGRAACPPACAVALRLETTLRRTVHGHSVARQVQIGSLHAKIAARGTRTLALKLNAVGRALLRRVRRLRVLARLVVEDQQGASWRIARALTLTSSSRAAGTPGAFAPRLER